MGKAKASSRKTNDLGSSGGPRSGCIRKRPKANTLRKFLTTMPGEHNLKTGVNIYEQLQSDSAVKNNKQQQPTINNKTYRPPPLIVTGNNNGVKDLLNVNGINKFNLKIISIGTKIFLENDDDFNKVHDALKSQAIEFFTHSTKGQKVLKVVLSGLPELPTKVIQDELALLNIYPTQISIMTTRKPNPHRALYLLHLNSNEMTLQDLNKVKAVYHTIVKWNKYKPNFRGPTQCRNCSMYGHGTQNCHRKPICNLCASSDHNQSNCPLRSLDKDSSPVYKCSYCARNNYTPINHRASDPNCPGRRAYTDSRKQSANHQNAKRQPIQSTESQPKKRTFIDAPAPVPLTSTFSNIVSNIQKDSNHARNDTDDKNGEHQSESLFSTSELLQIFTNAIGQIRNCRTKLDQIQVIASLISHAI